MTRRSTSWPVAITILVILGVAHFYWVTLAGRLVTYAVFPESWHSHGTLYGFAITFPVVTILSFPLAFFILQLQPKRVLFYLTFALTPTFSFYTAMGIQLEGADRNLQNLAGFMLIPIGLTLAIVVLQKLQRSKAPSKSLEQSRHE